MIGRGIIFFFVCCLLSCSGKKEVDIIIRNGLVYDGVSEEPQKLDIAIKEDKIIFLGDVEKAGLQAKENIDATGLIVSPGFIDAHTHADRDLVDFTKSHIKSFLFQGATTVVVGNDGKSVYPFSKFQKNCTRYGIGTNVVALVGHGTIRNEVLGNSNKKATEADIVKMQNLIQKEMDAGVYGMSTGLYYVPGAYADTEEVIALSKTVAKNDGIYDSHVRDEGPATIIPSLEEAIEIGRQAKLPIHISHIKCFGDNGYKQAKEIIEMVEKARAEGINVTANQYPYDAPSTSLKAVSIPKWAQSGGIDSVFVRFDQPALRKKMLEETSVLLADKINKLLVVTADDKTLVGKKVVDIAEELNLPVEEAVYKILRDGYVKIALFDINTKAIAELMAKEWVVTGSDGGSGHPRKYGTFPRKYNLYVKQDSVIDLAGFIRNSTSKTAEIYKIEKRGRIKEGYYADIIAFDPNNFKDKATYIDAYLLSEGLKYSIINGKLSVVKGEFTKQLNGKVLQKTIEK